MVQTIQQIMEILQLLLILVVDVPVAGSCRFSGAAVEKPLALPQLQLVEKSVTFYVPSYSAVTCSVFAFEVQDSGHFWEIDFWIVSRIQRFMVQHGTHALRQYTRLSGIHFSANG